MKFLVIRGHLSEKAVVGEKRTVQEVARFVGFADGVNFVRERESEGTSEKYLLLERQESGKYRNTSDIFREQSDKSIIGWLNWMELQTPHNLISDLKRDMGSAEIVVGGQ